MQIVCKIVDVPPTRNAHTLISIVKADVPEQLLKDALGHAKDMDTFGTYGYEVEREMQKVANILDGIFDKLLE